ncbi:ABC transporter permease [Nodosilinea sp. PGN35]|uniref:ABC transporter permease n=1 Tax=Nodosilinea sp. PGN35 TaxID=3020489 RepID=UPI0023B34461|nr:ABC transporter permease [Nodosilinea sp. TSF1-S3]MDF0365204.1 ABC transporter permease [Nodosilinea sp. TSF1-S3]
MKLISATPWGVYSVWWRHFQVYRSTWLVNCLPPISEPIVYLLAFGYGLTPLIGDVEYLGQMIPYARFLAPGMIAIGVLFQSFFEGAYSSFIRLNFQKTWQALLTAPLSYTDVFLGDWFWAATKGIIAGTLTGLVAVLANLYDPSSLVLSLPLIVLGSLLFGAFGLLVAGAVDKVDQVNVPIFLVIIPMFTLCGTYFPRDTLPPLLAQFAAFLPLASLVDLLRWPLGLPPEWPLLLLWLAGWMVVMARLAALRIYPRLFS